MVNSISEATSLIASKRNELLQAQGTLASEELKSQAVRDAIVKAQQQQMSQRALRQGSQGGINAMISRQRNLSKIQEQQNLLQQRENLLSDYGTELQGVEQQIRTAESGVAQAQRSQVDFERALDVFSGGESVFALDTQGSKDYYKQLQEGKRDAVESSITDLKTQGVTDAKTLSEVREFLTFNAGKISSQKLNEGANQILAGGLTADKFTDIPAIELPQQVNLFSSGADFLPLVSAKSLNVTPTSNVNVFNGTIGNGSRVDGSSRLRNISFNSLISNIDDFKKTYKTQLGQDESYVSGLGYTSTPMGAEQKTLTVRPLTISESEAINRASDLGSLNSALLFPSKVADNILKIPSYVGDVTTDIFSTRLEVNPLAGSYGQSLYNLNKVPEDTSLLTIKSQTGFPKLPYETRGTIDYLSNPQGRVYDIKDTPLIFTPRTAGNVAAAGTLFTPFLGQAIGGAFLFKSGVDLGTSIGESGFKQGTIRFVKEKPFEALGILGVGAYGLFKGGKYLTTELKTPIAGRGVSLVDESYFLGPVKGRRGISYQAGQTYRIPKTYERVDTRLKQLGRGALDLYYGELSPSKYIDILKPKRVQISPTILQKYSTSFPLTGSGDVIFGRGAVRSQRILPTKTKFTKFRARDVTDKTLNIKVSPGKDLTPGIEELQGKVSGGISEQILLPTKQMKKVLGDGILFRQSAREGGRRLTVKLDKTATMILPRARTQFTKAQRIPIKGDLGIVYAESIPLETAGKSFDLKRFRQSSRDLLFNPIKRVLKVSGKEERGVLDIAYPRKEIEFDFVPMRTETGLPSPTNVLISEKKQSLIQQIYGKSTGLEKSLPTSNLVLGTPKPRANIIVKTKTAQGSVVPGVRTGGYAGTGQYERTDGQQFLPSRTGQSNILGLSQSTSSRQQSATILGLSQQSNLDVGRVSRFDIASPQAERVRSAERVRASERIVTRNITRTPETIIRFYPKVTSPKVKPPRPPPPKIIKPFGIETTGRSRRYAEPKRRTPSIFTAQTKRGGKIINIASGSDFSQVFTGGKAKVRDTLRASLRILRNGRPVILPEVKDFTRSKRSPDFLVQKRGTRLGSFGERREIKQARSKRGFFI